MSTKGVSTIPSDVVEIQSAMQYQQLFEKYKDFLIILTFYTNTCPVCAAFKPQFLGVQQEFTSQKVIFARINSELLPNVADQFGIMAVPTTIFLKNKNPIFQGAGMYPKPQFRSLVNDALKKYFNIKNTDENMMYM